MITQFTSTLFCPPETGHVLVIGGKTVDGAKRLDLNLTTGCSFGAAEDADIAMQLSVLFDEDAIVRNSREAGAWGEPERDENRQAFTVGNPLVAGEPFKIYILISEFSFRIALNDEAYCSYDFRSPVQTIRCLELRHDLQAITQCDHRAIFPAPMPPIQLADGCDDGSGRIEFSNDCPQRFRAGHVLVITGIPYGNSRGQFVVRFTEGASRKQALHFNARFDPEYAVVRNAMTDRLEFGAEEREGAFPFFIDEQFKLAIAFARTEFRFAVNGKVFGAFAYRSANQLAALNGLRISANRGMHMEVTGVDHMHLGDADCTDFQQFSHPEWNVLSVATDGGGGGGGQ